MKSVLMSIQPVWCELIASGKKTVEVRKTRPKIETPFKCYIYCSLDGYKKGYKINVFDKYDVIMCGNVIGEFVCDCITPLYNICVDEWDLLQGGLHNIEKNLVKMAKLSENELKQYANGKYPLFAWHISDLVIYDKPKALSEFTKPYGTIIKAFDSKFIERPPQSWCYVEEVK